MKMFTLNCAKLKSTQYNILKVKKRNNSLCISRKEKFLAQFNLSLALPLQNTKKMEIINFLKQISRWFNALC
jgi:hypothetical protein